MPGTFVEIALNAELDLGSHVSTWLGPPSSHSRMTDCAFAPETPAAAAARRCCARLIPKKPREPTRKKSRREACSRVILKHPVESMFRSSRSMILGEFPRAQQRPHKVFQRRFTIATGSDQVSNGAQFPRLGRPPECRQVKLFDNLRIVLAGAKQLLHPPGRGAELFVVSRTGE